MRHAFVVGRCRRYPSNGRILYVERIPPLQPLHPVTHSLSSDQHHPPLHHNPSLPRCSLDREPGSHHLDRRDTALDRPSSWTTWSDVEGCASVSQKCAEK